MMFNGPILCTFQYIFAIDNFICLKRAQTLQDAHAKGITQDQIQGALRSIPFVCFSSRTTWRFS